MGPRYAALTSTIPVEPFSPPFHLAFHRLLLKGLTFIIKLLPLCETQIYLHLTVHKVELERNQRISPLFHLTD